VGCSGHSCLSAALLGCGVLAIDSVDTSVSGEITTVSSSKPGNSPRPSRVGRDLSIETYISRGIVRVPGVSENIEVKPDCIHAIR
jgi:hypothetical protein